MMDGVDHLLSLPQGASMRNAIAGANVVGSAKFESGWMGVNGYRGNADLALGIGSFSANVVANRSPSGKWCKLLYIADRYNFTPGTLADSDAPSNADGSPGNGIMFDPSGKDSVMNHLFRVGLAKPFNLQIQIDLP
jgi:hypothetical protein